MKAQGWKEGWEKDKKSVWPHLMKSRLELHTD